MPNDVDLTHLHPAFATRTEQLLDYAQEQKKMPIRLFEGYRPPERQAHLYSEGRIAGIGKPGHHVTFERAWQSNHQYGMAGDFVWFYDGKWSWDPPAGHSWDELHEIADKVGLEYLDWEKPHLQLKGFRGRDILSGVATFPEHEPIWAAEEKTWAENFDAAVLHWGNKAVIVDGIIHPAPPKLIGADRPPITVPDGMYWDDRQGKMLWNGA